MRTLCLLGLGMWLCACGGLGLDKALPKADEGKQEVLGLLVDDAVEDGLPGVILHAETAEGASVVKVGGFADLGARRPMEASHLFRIASNSKAFLGVVAAQLHDEGALDLDAPVGQHLPDEVIERIENADRATLRQMLQHTSGIFDYLGNEDFWDDAFDKRTHQWQTTEILGYAFDQPADFEPGEDWSYSNTNYILAGLVIDGVTGAHHSRAIRTRILDPLGMDATFYEHQEAIEGDIVHGYADFEGSPALDDAFAFDHGYGKADGGLVSTAADLATFIKALGSGDLLSESAQAQMFDKAVALPKGERYGLGISVLQTEVGEAITHGGALIGYQSDMVYLPASDTTLIVFANGSDDDLDEVFADLLADALEAVAR